MIQKRDDRPLSERMEKPLADLRAANARLAATVAKLQAQIDARKSDRGWRTGRPHHDRPERRTSENHRGSGVVSPAEDDAAPPGPGTGDDLTVRYPNVRAPGESIPDFLARFFGTAAEHERNAITGDPPDVTGREGVPRARA